MPDRLAFVQRTPLTLKRRVDRLADRRGVSTNTLINELLEQALADAEQHELQDA